MHLQQISEMRATLLTVDKGVHSGIQHSMNLNINFITNDNISFILCIISKLFVYINKRVGGKSVSFSLLQYESLSAEILCLDRNFVLYLYIYI